MKLKIVIFLFFTFGFLTAYRAQTGDLFNRFRLGQSYEQAGDFQKAKSVYESVFKQQPDNFQFFDALNRVYIQLKDYDASISIIQQRLKSVPQDINMYGLLGSSYYLKGDETKAYESWDEAIKIFSDKPMVYRVIANYAIERRAFDKAVEILQQGKKVSNDSFNFSLDIANIFAMLMKYKEAASELAFLISKDPSQLVMVETRLSSYINKADAQKQTIEVIEEWTNKNEDINLFLLLGWLYMEAGRYKDAYETYLKIDEMNKNTGSELYNFAERALKDGHSEEASKAYKKIFEDYPNSPFAPGAKIGYAKTLEMAVDQKNNITGNDWKPFYSYQAQNPKDYQEVIAAYSDLISQYDGLEVAYESYFRIGSIKLERLSDFTGAEESLKKVVSYSQISPFTVPSYTKLADIAILRGDLAQALDYYDKILESPRAQSSDKNLSTYMKARIQFWNGNFSGANDLLKNVESNFNENYTNDAIELSLLINTTKNDSLSLSQFAEAELFAFQKKFKAASEIYSKLSSNENLLTVKDLAALRYAEMALALNDLPNTITLLSAISSQGDKNIYADKAVFLLGEVYQYSMNDAAKAVESYENLLAKFPNSLYLDEARENINEMKKKSSNNL
ncbi:MAG: tetratricopeptide repeat protein [Bacillota bacterium]